MEKFDPNKPLLYNFDQAGVEIVGSVNKMGLQSAEARQAEIAHRAAMLQELYTGALEARLADEEDITVAEVKRIQTELDRFEPGDRTENSKTNESDPHHDLKEAIVVQAEKRFNGQQRFAEESGGVDADGNKLPDNNLELYKAELQEFLNRRAEDGTLAHLEQYIKDRKEQGEDVEIILASTPNALFSSEQQDKAATAFGEISDYEAWKYDDDSGYVRKDKQKIYANKTPEQISGAIVVYENGEIPHNRFTLRTSDFNLDVASRKQQINQLHDLQKQAPTARGPRDIEQVALWYELKEDGRPLVDYDLTSGRNLDEDTDPVADSDDDRMVSHVYISVDGEPYLFRSDVDVNDIARAVMGD